MKREANVTDKTKTVIPIITIIFISATKNPSKGIPTLRYGTKNTIHIVIAIIEQVTIFDK